MAIILPTKKTKPRFNFEDEKILLCGDNKKGKTSLAAYFSESILFIATEAGHRKVDVFRYPAPESGRDVIESWEEYLEVMKMVKESKAYKMVCVDTMDCLWILYRNHFLKKYEVSHEGDIPWKGWSMIAREFASEFLALQAIGIGYVMIYGIKNTGTDDKPYIQPNIYIDKEREVWRATVGVADLILYMDVEETVFDPSKPDESDRVIHTEASSKFFAGSRITFPNDTIRLVKNNPEKSARRIINAYNQGANNYVNSKKENVQNGTGKV